MRKSLWIILFLFVVIGAPNAHAQTTYTYTGNDFTTFDGVTCPSDCSIDGSFTIPSPLAASTTTYVTPTAFDFYISTADSPTWTNLNGALVGSFGFITNSSDAIIEWNIDMYSAGITDPYFVTMSIPSQAEDGFETTDTPTETFAENSFIPGTWTSASLTPMPEPTSLTLLLLGIFAVGIMTHRARKAEKTTPAIL
jgi:hypothetical protein